MLFCAFVILASFATASDPPRVNRGSSELTAIRPLGGHFTRNDTVYLLYTRENPERYEILSENGKPPEIEPKYFKKGKPVKILIPGWHNNNDSAFSILLRESYLLRYDCNVILVDWFKYSKEGYRMARSMVSKVGQQVADLIDSLYKNLDVKMSHIHMVGHSLGAHVAGIAGSRTTTGNIARITGLDPAGPLFSFQNVDRLRRNSAVFVDVVHTCGLALGFFEPIGHVDFYPNRGLPIQPGCGVDLTGLKSHRRAFWYFAESITSGGFHAVECPDWKSYKKGKCHGDTVEMGEPTHPRTRGIYYLETRAQSPFALGRVPQFTLR